MQQILTKDVIIQKMSNIFLMLFDTLYTNLMINPRRMVLHVFAQNVLLLSGWYYILTPRVNNYASNNILFYIDHNLKMHQIARSVLSSRDHFGEKKTIQSDELFVLKSQSQINFIIITLHSIKGLECCLCAHRLYVNKKTLSETAVEFIAANTTKNKKDRQSEYINL